MNLSSSFQRLDTSLQRIDNVFLHRLRRCACLQPRNARLEVARMLLHLAKDSCVNTENMHIVCSLREKLVTQRLVLLLVALKRLVHEVKGLYELVVLLLQLLCSALQLINLFHGGTVQSVWLTLVVHPGIHAVLAFAQDSDLCHVSVCGHSERACPQSSLRQRPDSFLRADFLVCSWILFFTCY